MTPNLDLADLIAFAGATDGKVVLAGDTKSPGIPWYWLFASARPTSTQGA